MPLVHDVEDALREVGVDPHYYKFTFHYRHFHCCSDKSVGVILPSLVGPIGRPRKE